MSEREQCECRTCGTVFKRKPQTTGNYCSNICANRGSARPRPIAERFWLKVQKTEGCWLWTASKNNKGYGWINCAGRSVTAHRTSWEMHFGKLADGVHVLHRCDTPACVNPNHLFLGDAAVNAADKKAKGRAASPRGEAHGFAKLKAADIQKIKTDKRTARLVGLDYGVTKSTIVHVRTGRTWKHL